jgi:hypothetical protein
MIQELVLTQNGIDTKINFDKYKFRCSALGNLMTEARSKSEPLSETTKSYLMECYVAESFNRRQDITSKFLEKGTMVEENAIDLYSLVKGDFFKKNEDKLSNDFICGTPDIIHEEGSSKIIIDIKSSFDIYTFAKSMKAENKMYYWQVQSYMALTGAKKAIIAYCLVDTPDPIIEREIKKALYQSGIGENTPDFIAYATEMRNFYQYSDIPKEKRVFERSYEFNQDDIDALYKRIIECRTYLNNINW